ncbi:MAG: hypothetical protein QM765_29420 [Myxococcales bacterium]
MSAERSYWIEPSDLASGVDRRPNSVATTGRGRTVTSWSGMTWWLTWRWKPAPMAVRRASDARASSARRSASRRRFDRSPGETSSLPPASASSSRSTEARSVETPARSTRSESASATSASRGVSSFDTTGLELAQARETRFSST